jgi:parallel beta-helix repeat protein
MNMKKGLSFAVITLFIGIALAPSITASEPTSNQTVYSDETGILSGYVTDIYMEPIEGAIIRALCGENYFENVSDSSGYYYIDNIPIIFCLWNISASKTGYKTIWVEMSIGENTKYDFVLTPLGNTLYVGGSGAGNYTTIQSAIDDTDDYDTVFVYSGTYYENIVVDKSITLKGEDKNTTVIDGGNGKDVVKINGVDKVTILGFTIQNGGENKAGVYLYRSADGVISGNFIIDNPYGVYVYKNASTGLSHTTITDNIILRSGVFGVWLYKSSYNIISDNIISDGEIYGLGLCFWSTDTIVNGNTISNNKIKGIVGRYVYNNEIYENIIENNGYGIHFMNAVSNNRIHDNHIEDNTMYGICFENISTNNMIERNNFMNNTPRNAFFITPFSTTNKWDNNYWDKGRIFPYPIFGKIQIGIIQLPWMNFDWHPAKEPYDISMGL